MSKAGDDVYWACRRSLRLWPVPGPDLKKSLADFMKNRLKISTSTLLRMGDIGIKKVFSAPGAKIQDEVVVLFAEQEVRDAVRRSAKELAGDSSAGIRLEVPRSLQSSLKALEAVSFALKQKNKKMKRNIKFDDSIMDLVLDFNLDPEGGGPWRTLKPDQARKFKGKIGSSGTADVEEDELDQMLGSGSGSSG